MSVLDPLLGDARERAEHALTLRRPLVALGWACLVGALLVVVAVVAGSRSLAGAGETLALWLVSQLVGGAVLAVPGVGLGLWALRHMPRGRAPRVVVGAVAGLVLGLVEQLLFTGASPWWLIRSEPDAAAYLLLAPLVAGAVAGALVGPRPEAPAAGPGPDERAEDALLDPGPGTSGGPARS